MKNRILITPLLFLFLTLLACQNEKTKNERQIISIIPEPHQMQILTEQAFTINEKTEIVVRKSDKEAQRIAQMFITKFQKASSINLSLNTSDVSGESTIFFTTGYSSSSLGAESYELEASSSIITIKASKGAGLFYGMQTLLALLPTQIESETTIKNNQWTVPAVVIKDEPKFSWRGLHLDVARHFMPVDFIKKYIDYMAMHKLNTFHWHLTEDQGWRIEIKQYPKLTEVGSVRKETLKGHAYEKPQKFDARKHGGFYTQEEIKDVVKYAEERFITIVPEIEMPGHASAAIAAYPELGVTGEQIEVATSWGVFPDIYNVNDGTFTFLKNVLEEVMELFPGKYIHIGGDEAIKDQWKASSDIQNKIKLLGLKDEHELQSYFITRIERFVNSKGRQIIGWDEILEGGLAPNAAVMSWRGESGGITAAKSKHKVVMSPGSHLYFDHYQGSAEFEPLAIGGHTTLEKVYSYDPIPDALTKEEASYLMGAQANLWTEYMPSTKHVEYMLFPRIGALAEVVWSHDKDWNLFKEKLPKQLERYDFKQINYSKSIMKVTFEKTYDSLSNTAYVTLKNQMDYPDIRYTLDSLSSFEHFLPYTKPIKIENTLTVKAVLFHNNEPNAEVTQKTFRTD